MVVHFLIVWFVLSGVFALGVLVGASSDESDAR